MSTHACLCMCGPSYLALSASPFSSGLLYLATSNKFHPHKSGFYHAPAECSLCLSSLSLSHSSLYQLHPKTSHSSSNSTVLFQLAPHDPSHSSVFPLQMHLSLSLPHVPVFTSFLFVCSNYSPLIHVYRLYCIQQVGDLTRDLGKNNMLLCTY